MFQTSTRALKQIYSKSSSTTLRKRSSVASPNKTKIRPSDEIVWQIRHPQSVWLHLLRSRLSKNSQIFTSLLNSRKMRQDKNKRKAKEPRYHSNATSAAAGLPSSSSTRVILISAIAQLVEHSKIILQSNTLTGMVMTIMTFANILSKVYELVISISRLKFPWIKFLAASLRTKSSASATTSMHFTWELAKIK